VKFARAAYLVCIGARALLSRESGLRGEDARNASSGRWSAFRSGVLTNLLNPKVALFFLALMPQFIDAASMHKVAAFMALGLTFVLLGVVWCCVLAIAAASLRGWFLRKPSMATVLNRVAGAMFVALGLKLATTRQ
jgi:threonine/homoserine/homoserine lactone efflux protein